MISALVSAGLDGGYLANLRLAKVHWQAGDRPLPAARVSVAGESAVWVDPADVPAAGDIGKLGRALRARLRPRGVDRAIRVSTAIAVLAVAVVAASNATSAR